MDVAQWLTHLIFNFLNSLDFQQIKFIYNIY